MKRALLLSFLLGLLAFGLRTAYLVKTQSYRNFGNAEMERVSVSLARYGTIGNTYSDTSGPSAHVSPLYPLLLGGIYAAFGWDTVTGRLFQGLCAILATTLALFFLPALARKTGLSETAGWLAAFCLAVLPVNLWTETSGSWEQPYAALALLGLVWAFCDLRAGAWRGWRRMVLVGIGLGVIALLSPSLLAAGGLMFLAQLALERRNIGQIVRAGAVVGGVVLVLVAPWLWRNYHAVGGACLRSNMGLELALGNNDYANGKTFPVGWDDPKDPTTSMRPLTSKAELAKLQSMGELPYMAEKKRQGMQWIQTHPGRAALLVVKRFMLYWFPSSDMWPARSSARWLKAAVFCLISLGMFGGLCRLAWRRHWAAGLLAAALLGASAAYMITHVDPRYRYPVFALSTLVACDFFLALGGQVRRWLAGKSPASAPSA